MAGYFAETFRWKGRIYQSASPILSSESAAVLPGMPVQRRPCHCSSLSAGGCCTASSAAAGKPRNTSSAMLVHNGYW